MKIRRSLLFFFVLIGFSASAQIQVRGPIPVAQNGPSQYDTTYALIVGISKYQNVQSLQYADADARAFNAFLRSPAGGNVDSTNIKLLLNEDAKAQSILTALSWLKARASSHTRIYIYFACHGDSYDEQEAFLLAYDAPPGGDDNLYLGNGTIQVANLKHRVKYMTSKSAEVILITDACRTNDLPGKVNGVRYTNAKIMEENEGEIQFASCSANQTSMEGSGWGGGRGLFSYHLINGMSGLADKDNDGNVSWFELKNYVIDSVRADSKSASGAIKQTPTFYCEETKIDLVAEHVDPKTKARVLQAIHPTNKPKSYAKGSNVTRAALIHFDDYKTQQDYLSFQAELEKQNYVKPKRGGSNSKENDATAYQDNAENAVNSFVDQEKVDQKSTCAFSQLQKLLRSEFVSEERKSDLKDMYIDEVMNYCQDLINNYLGGDRSILSSSVMSNAAGAMKSLNGMVVLEGNERNSFMGKYYYFMAREKMSEEDSKQRRIGIAYCDSALKYQPSAAYIYNTRGVLHGSLGEYELGRADVDRARALAPNWVFPMVGMAILELKSNKTDQAISWYKKALEVDPKFSLAYDRLANIYHEQYKNFGGNNDSLAFDCLRKSIAIAPQYSQPYIFMAGGLADYYKMDSAMYYINMAYSKDSTDPFVVETLADFYSNSNSTIAKKYYQRSLELGADSSEVFSSIGQLMEKEGKDSIAYEYYKKAYSINKWNETALTCLVGYWKKYNADDVSMRFINSLIASDSTRDYLYRLKGDIYFRKEDGYSARENYLIAYRLDPNKENGLSLIRFYSKVNPSDPMYMELLSRGDSLIPRSEEMVQVNMEHQIINGNLDSAYRLIRYYQPQIEHYNSLKYFAGQICSMNEKYDEAISWYTKAGKLEPESDYRVYIVNTLMAKGDFQAATKVAREQVASRPKNAEGRLLLGNLYLQAGFADSAIAVAGPATPSIEKEFQKSFILGRAYQLKGDNKKAISNFENCISQKPDFSSSYLCLSQIYQKKAFKKGKAKKYLDKYNELQAAKKAAMKR